MEGCSIGGLLEWRAARFAHPSMTGVAKNTVSKLVLELGAACTPLPERDAGQPAVQAFQCDEIWSYVGAKDKNLSAEREQGLGSICTWTCL